MQPQDFLPLHQRYVTNAEHRMAAICEIAMFGRMNPERVKRLSAAERAELMDWSQGAAHDFLKQLVGDEIEEVETLGEEVEEEPETEDELEEVEPEPEPITLEATMADPSPATVDINREDLQEVFERGILRINRLPHLTPKERERAIARLGRRVLRAAITADTVHGIYQFLDNLIHRDPDELRERAQIAREDGDEKRAQRLEADAAAIEARRGNG